MVRRRGWQIHISDAELQEKKFEWIAAIKFYERAAAAALKEHLDHEAAKLTRRIGVCYLRAALKAGSSREFKNRMRLALNQYKEAAKAFKEATGPLKQAEILRCQADAAYVSFCLQDDGVSRKRWLDKCLNREKTALICYLKSNDQLNLGRTYSKLNRYLVERLSLEWNRQTRQRILREALECGENAISIFQELNEKHELSRAYYTTAIHYNTRVNCLERGKRNEYQQKTLDYVHRAVELSEEIGDPFLIGMSNIQQAIAIINFTDKPENAEDYLTKALTQGLQTGDNYLVGRVYYLLAFLLGWKIIAEEDPEKAKEMLGECRKYVDDSIHRLKVINADWEVANSYYWRAENHITQAKSEATWKRKYLFLKKAEVAGKTGLKYAKRSGSIDATWFILHPLSKSLFFQSTLETEIIKKKKLLESALKYREENLRALRLALPHFHWNLGAYHNYLALIQAGLAKTKTDKEEKVSLLTKAVASAEKCIKFCGQSGSLLRGVHAFTATFGKYHFDYGGILNQLYKLTNSLKLLHKLLEVLRGAIEAYEKVDLPSRVAEGYWQIAAVHHELRNYANAAENFDLAGQAYSKAARKIQSLADFYQEHVSYMQAWREIEKARYYHSRARYDEAKNHYELAANKHKSTKSWKYLATNYLALAQVEHGESLSRQEHPEEAKWIFEEAAKLFNDARKSISMQVDNITSREEQQMAMELFAASVTRRDYCLGRIALEDGKILDNQGDHVASSEKYGTAAEIFQSAISSMTREWDRKELKPIVSLCKAWREMAKAEAEASPHRYLEASNYFDEAKEHSFDEKTKLLAAGHSSFCKALEKGRRFEATRDLRLHSVATKYLEGAENFYVRAGFASASEYVKATQRLFDAHMYTYKAKTEINPRKKAQYYRISEKLLQASATSYSRAGKPEKTQNVQRFLDGIREERELALSLTEAIQPSTIISTTTSFSTPTPSFEKAVGLERFEGANVHVDLSLDKEETTVGEDFRIKINITNVGKEPVLLTKMEDLFPEGFEVVVKPDNTHREYMDLNLENKRLNPLKTEQLNLVLRSFSQGKHTIQARVNCVDENGHTLLCAPQPVELQISEIEFPDRIATGFRDLDTLLCGGIPENYAVVLTSLSCDEKDKLINRFLENGAENQQITFFLTVGTRGAEALSEFNQSNTHFFICNPTVDSALAGQPNIHRLDGVKNLTSIGIAITSTFRKLDTSIEGPRRACIEILSDVLLQHGAVSARRWLSALLPELKSRGFITLAVLNPYMHSQQDVQAILDLFDGEINLVEKKAEDGGGKFLKVKKLYNKRYLNVELPLK
ncbi:MAG: hypothetical protein JSV35_03720 [Candidatus Bathyarchaeota archaeon]|nr:MAG: hypothetical protein JSV35_03720 [Candidatus Bathyarchaeota archaeon]